MGRRGNYPLTTRFNKPTETESNNSGSTTSIFGAPRGCGPGRQIKLCRECHDWSGGWFVTHGVRGRRGGDPQDCFTHMFHFAAV
ncbi:hypothetical protein J6590_028810 [Homalodisca vitripennis]|nr:hypothetical protein J6590_028810 [Homalodisca vitripennis]